MASAAMVVGDLMISVLLGYSLSVTGLGGRHAIIALHQIVYRSILLLVSMGSAPAQFAYGTDETSRVPEPSGAPSILAAARHRYQEHA